MGKLMKAMALDGNVRIFICDTTDIVAEAQKRHGLWPTASAALGRVLSIASMMGSDLKNKQEKLTITINGGGPIGTVMASSDASGNVRGFVSNPEVHYEYHKEKKLAVGIAVGTDGYLEVKKDLGLKEDFNGKVALQTGEIGDDFAYYLAVSEQIPSLVSVGVLVNEDNSIASAGGMIIEMMPGASEEDTRKVEEATKDLKPMSDLIASKQSLEDILKSIFPDVKILETREIKYECNCSKEKMEQALMTLSDDDLDAMIAEDHGCELTCQFCKNQYQFDEEELKHIKELKHKK